MNIPKKLVSFYHSKDLPIKMKENVTDWITKNPNINIKVYDITEAENFIKDNFDTKVLKAYLTLKPYSYKSDLFRFCYIYKYGGIYVDIKFKQVGDFTFSDLLDREYLVSEPIGIQSCLIILQPNSKYMLKCIQTVVTNTLNYDYGYTPILTGPIPLSENYDEFYKNNKIDNLQWEIENHLQVIKNKNNDNIILKQYDEYRDELIDSDQPHYEYLYWHRDIYFITESKEDIPADKDILNYLNSYVDLKKAFGINIYQGRKHWFEYGIKEGRKLYGEISLHSKEEENKLIYEGVPIKILSCRKICKNYFVYVSKLNDENKLKLTKNDIHKDNDGSKFIITKNKNGNGYTISSYKYPELKLNTFKNGSNYDLRVSKVTNPEIEGAIFEISKFSDKIIIKSKHDNGEYLFDAYEINKKFNIRLTKTKDSPDTHGGWGLFKIKKD